MKWELIAVLIEWLMGCVRSQWCVSFPLKANTAKQSHGPGRGAGRQADWRLASPPLTPPPSFPSSNKPDTKEAASDNTNSTMIGSDGSQSAAKSGGVIIDCFFLFASADQVGKGGDWRKMRMGGGVLNEPTYIKKYIYIYTKQIESDLLEEREENFPHIN